MWSGWLSAAPHRRPFASETVAEDVALGLAHRLGLVFDELLRRHHLQRREPVLLEKLVDAHSLKARCIAWQHEP